MKHYHTPECLTADCGFPVVPVEPRAPNLRRMPRGLNASQPVPTPEPPAEPRTCNHWPGQNECDWCRPASVPVAEACGDPNCTFAPIRHYAHSEALPGVYAMDVASVPVAVTPGPKPPCICGESRMVAGKCYTAEGERTGHFPKPLTRYRMDADGYGYVEEPDPNGEWVKYADVAALAGATSSPALDVPTLAAALLTGGLWPVYDPSSPNGFRGGPFDLDYRGYAALLAERYTELTKETP